MATDYYDILGLTRDATSEDIKKAYRRLARQHHPDANSGDPDSAERFKEVSRAYEVLSDPRKRQNYDTFGDERRGMGGFGGFGDVGFGGISDIFDAFFGGGSRPGARTGPARGSDVLAEVELTLEEAARGVEREVTVTTLDDCPECHGSGSAPGTFPSTCPDCGGTGEVRHVRRTMLGNMMTASPCRRCGGTGREVTDPCTRCEGAGRVSVDQTLTVQIPAGVDDGAQLRVTGHGETGVRGGRKGDLYVAIRVAEHDIFRRAGEDLACEVSVPMSVAALGGEIQVPTLDGSEDHRVEPGTQSGSMVRLRGQGMPRLDGRGRGTLIAVLKIETPTDLSAEEAEVLARFAELRGEHPGGKGSLLHRMREAFK